MKKFLFILLLTIICAGCNIVEKKIQEVKDERAMYGVHTTGGSTEYHIVNIDGHQYIVFRSAYGISVLHSESCSCKNKKK